MAIPDFSNLAIKDTKVAFRIERTRLGPETTRFTMPPRRLSSQIESHTQGQRTTFIRFGS